MIIIARLIMVRLYYDRVFLLALLLMASCSPPLARSASTVEFLPGFQGPLPFQLETGYVGVGESEEVQLFYYFVKSEGNPEKDPLLLWLTGGPGCSAWSGLVYEIGPLNYKIEPYNGSLPTLVLNPYSWTKISSIVFIDSPVGTGFSYSKSSSASETGDLKQVQGLFQFFKKWLIDHQEFISNPVYIAGDSYSGITVPVLAQEISNGIEEGILPPINLQGYILGNPATSPSDDNYKIPFAHGMALISDELFRSLKRRCRGKYYGNIDSSNTECLKEFRGYEECISGIRSTHILEPDCTRALTKPHEDKIDERRSLNQNSEAKVLLSESPLPWFGCPGYPHLLSRYWANDPHVRKALHIQKGSIGEWNRCNWSLPYQHNIHSSVEYHANLSAKGYRSLIYSGDHDMKVPFLATQAWIRSLNYTIVDDWRSWVVQGQIAG
ncbi:serine carboxypeptidase-like 7 [Morus notabilis]|uniref:serine carboxypeptidase-like 7 n=1 Tax=Morus notabilis TaxID=981085 RepID=UPI000CECEC43|nr:serine carboxypeptidase-like 7 [Morus notabilis]